MLTHRLGTLAHSARDNATLDFYTALAPAYIAAGTTGISPYLRAFLDQLPPKARILELGCGSGRDAEAMIVEGFEVDPTDGTPEIAHEAEQRLGRSVRVMCFDELCGHDVYEAIWAFASLLHVPRNTLPQILMLVFNALKPGGLHFASYKAGGTEGRDKYGRYFNYLSKEDVGMAYQQSGPWQIVSFVEFQAGGYDSQDGPWVGVTVRKLR